MRLSIQIQGQVNLPTISGWKPLNAASPFLQGCKVEDTRPFVKYANPECPKHEEEGKPRFSAYYCKDSPDEFQGKFFCRTCYYWLKRHPDSLRSAEACNREAEPLGVTCAYDGCDAVEPTERPKDRRWDRFRKANFEGAPPEYAGKRLCDLCYGRVRYQVQRSPEWIQKHKLSSGSDRTRCAAPGCPIVWTEGLAMFERVPEKWKNAPAEVRGKFVCNPCRYYIKHHNALRPPALLKQIPSRMRLEEESPACSTPGCGRVRGQFKGQFAHAGLKVSEQFKGQLFCITCYQYLQKYKTLPTDFSRRKS